MQGLPTDDLLSDMPDVSTPQGLHGGPGGGSLRRTTLSSFSFVPILSIYTLINYTFYLKSLVFFVYLRKCAMRWLGGSIELVVT